MNIFFTIAAPILFLSSCTWSQQSGCGQTNPMKAIVEKSEKLNSGQSLKGALSGLSAIDVRKRMRLRPANMEIRKDQCCVFLEDPKCSDMYVMVMFTYSRCDISPLMLMPEYITRDFSSFKNGYASYLNMNGGKEMVAVLDKVIVSDR